MLNIREIKKHIIMAVEEFKEYFPDVNIPDIVVCPSANRNYRRDKILEECGLSYKDDSYTTLAEVISGEKATKIVLYQARMKNLKFVYRCVWHELGHILFGDEKQFGITKQDMDNGTILVFGYSLFNEFIAEYTAFEVNDFQPLAGNYLPTAYLYQAFYWIDEGIDIYKLSQYYAILLGDSTVSDEEFNKGETIISKETWNLVKVIMNLLFKQTEKDDFWKVDKEYLIKLGYLCNQLLHIDYRI